MNKIGSKTEVIMLSTSKQGRAKTQKKTKQRRNGKHNRRTDVLMKRKKTAKRNTKHTSGQEMR